MNDTQQIFVVFFAIIWGTTTGVHGRLKMFNYPLWGIVPQVRRRILLSHIFMNLFPLVFFGLAMNVLSHPPNTIVWSIIGTLRAIVHGVIPAMAIFGFYRFWLGIVESRPEKYYRKDDKTPWVPKGKPRLSIEIPKGIDPRIESLPLVLELSERVWGKNIFVAVCYILIALIALLSRFFWAG